MAENPRELSMFGFGFTLRDLARAVWVFVAVFVVTFILGVTGALKDLMTTCNAGACDLAPLKAAAVAMVPAAITAAALAVKNFVLRDGSDLKG